MKKLKRRTTPKFSNKVYIDKIDYILWDVFIEQQKLREMSIYEIQEALLSISSYLKVMLNYFSKDDMDARRGFETYGYSDLESIKSNLCYISDRWGCRFRIQWLLDLANTEELAM